MPKKDESYYYCVTFPEQPYAVLLGDYDSNPAEYTDLENPGFSSEIWRQFQIHDENFFKVLEQHPQAQAKLVHRTGHQEEILKTLSLQEVQKNLEEQDIHPGDEVTIEQIAFPKGKTIQPPKIQTIGTWTVPELVNFHQPLDQIRAQIPVHSKDQFIGYQNTPEGKKVVFSISGRGILHYAVSQVEPVYLVIARTPDGAVQPVAEGTETMFDHSRSSLTEFAERCPADTEFWFKKETYPVSILCGSIAGRECEMSPAILKAVRNEARQNNQEMVMTQSQFLHYIRSFPSARERILQKPKEEQGPLLIELVPPDKSQNPKIIGIVNSFPETEKDFASVLPGILYNLQQKYPEQAGQYTLDALKKSGAQFTLHSLIDNARDDDVFYRLSAKQVQPLLEQLDLQENDRLRFSLTRNGEEVRIGTDYKIGNPGEDGGLKISGLLKMTTRQLNFEDLTPDDLKPDDLIQCYRMGKDPDDNVIIFSISGQGLQDYDYREESQTRQVQAYAKNLRLPHQVQVLLNREEKEFSKDDLDTQIVNAYPESWKDNGMVYTAELDYPKSVLQAVEPDGLLVPGTSLYCSPMILENTQKVYDRSRLANGRSITAICQSLGVPVPGIRTEQKLSSEQDKEEAFDQREKKEKEKPVSDSGDGK